MLQPLYVALLPKCETFSGFPVFSSDNLISCLAAHELRKISSETTEHQRRTMKYTVVLAALSLTPAASLVIPSPAVTTDRWIATGQQSTVHRDDMLLMFRRRRSFQTVVVDGGRRGHFHHCHRRRRLHGKCTMSVSTSLSEILPSSSAMMSILAWCPAGLAIALVGTSVVHALQGGVRGDLGKTQEEILGVRAEEATARDISRLGNHG